MAVLLVAIMLLGAPTPRSAAEQASNIFDAPFTGTFEITVDLDESGLFVVEEAGSGTEQTELGAFTYKTTVLQDLNQIPAGCGPNSSTGVVGTAVLIFADGQMRLHRTSGTVCFTFPTIHVEEEWVIASGTGSYIGATGKLLREFVGDVRFGSAAGTMLGVIRYR